MRINLTKFLSVEPLSAYLQSPFSSRSNSPIQKSTESRPSTPSSTISISFGSQESSSPHRRISIIETPKIRKASVESPDGSLEMPESWMVNQYLILDELGSGSYGNVLKVKNTETHVLYACKVINKRRLKRQFQFRTRGQQSSEGLNMIKREIAILKKLSRHRNIIPLIEVLNDDQDDNLYMIFDLCVGPIMKLQINAKIEPFSEEKSLKYFRDIVSGLEFLHSQRIIHCDLKPENILLTHDDHALISDFGISHICDNSKDDLMTLKQGSLAFTPPEACDHHADTINGKALDVWCLGVTLFCFLHGTLPFETKNGNVLELFELILTTEPIYTLSSELAKDLLKQMLHKSPRQRSSIASIKVHPWVTMEGRWPMLSKEENCAVTELTSDEVENAMTHMSSLTKWIHRVKKAASFRSQKSCPQGTENKKPKTLKISSSSSDQEHTDSGCNISTPSCRK